MRGGIRSRLIIDSTRITILAGLIDLGWFDATIYDTPPGSRAHRPFRYIARPTTWDVELEPNALAITAELTTDDPHGLGEDVDDTVRFYADLFAESEQLGWEVAHDIADILNGRLPDLGRLGPTIDVWDLRLATPSPVTQVEVEDVRVDRSAGQTRAWQRYWFMVRADLIDEYGDEAGVPFTPQPWSPSFGDAWTRVMSV